MRGEIIVHLIAPVHRVSPTRISYPTGLGGRIRVALYELALGLCIPDIVIDLQHYIVNSLELVVSKKRKYLYDKAKL